MVSNERQKRKGMMIEEDYIPPAKKMRRDPESFMTKQEREATMIQSTDKAYAQQVMWRYRMWEGQKVLGTQM